MSIRSAILFTLAYADIFAYPLTFEELLAWLPYGDSYQKQAVRQEIRKLLDAKKVGRYRGYIFLGDGNVSVQKRLERAKEMKRKMRIARAAARFLSRIPTILFIGVTGGVSMGNADEDDDIDFFIITRAHTLWVTRFIATVFLDFLGKRRRPGSPCIKDRICLNMYVGHSALGMDRQDAFIAHEILQMIPLVHVRDTYEAFLSANVWVSYMFPRTWRSVWNKRMRVGIVRQDTICARCMSFLLQLVERPIMGLQVWHMRKRRTHEVVSDCLIRFHPRDARVWVNRKLAKRLGALHVKPLDK